MQDGCLGKSALVLEKWDDTGGSASQRFNQFGVARKGSIVRLRRFSALETSEETLLDECFELLVGNIHTELFEAVKGITLDLIKIFFI